MTGPHSRGGTTVVLLYRPYRGKIVKFRREHTEPVYGEVFSSLSKKAIMEKIEKLRDKQRYDVLTDYEKRILPQQIRELWNLYNEASDDEGETKM